MRNYISEQGLIELKNYQYKGGEYSWLDKKLNSWWFWVAEQFPLWLAPNLITFVGFLFLISSYVIILFLDFSLTKEVPRWIFLKAGFDILFYQTMDAADGKQARRTKTSSPLGQLFDHGCDSFTMTFVILTIAQSVHLEPYQIFFISIFSQLNCFSTNFIEYHSGVLNTQFHNFGVTELQFICALLYFVCFAWGTSFWDTHICVIFPGALVDYLIANQPNQYLVMFLNSPIKSVIANVIIVMFVITFVGGIYANKLYIKITKKEATLQFTPIIMLLIIEFAWYQSDIFPRYAGLIMVSFGLLVSLITCKLIVCSMTKMKYAKIHFDLFPVIFVTAVLILFNQNLTMRMKEYLTLFVFIVNVLLVYLFCSGVISQITEYLQIYCFSLRKRNSMGNQDNNKKELGTNKTD